METRYFLRYILYLLIGVFLVALSVYRFFNKEQQSITSLFEIIGGLLILFAGALGFVLLTRKSQMKK
jgi:hypothetical protein